MTFIDLINTRLEQLCANKNSRQEWIRDIDKIDGLDHLSKKIKNLADTTGREIILLIDEVDKSTNNQLFLHFLGMLRNKYLDRTEGLDNTFICLLMDNEYYLRKHFWKEKTFWSDGYFACVHR